MPMFGQGNQLPPWLQQQEDPTGNPWSHINNTVRALLAGGLGRQRQQSPQTPNQTGASQPHFDVPLSGPFAKPEQTMPTTSDPAVTPPVPYLGAGGLPSTSTSQPSPTPPTQASSTPLDGLLKGGNPFQTIMSMASNNQVPTPQHAWDWMMNAGANGQIPSAQDTMKWAMGGGQGGLGNLFGSGFADLFKPGGGGSQPNQGGNQSSGGFA